MIKLLLESVFVISSTLINLDITKPHSIIVYVCFGLKLHAGIKAQFETLITEGRQN